MDSSRTLRLVAVLLLFESLLAGSATAAQSSDKHTLAAKHRSGELQRVDVALQVGGDVKLVGEDGKSQSLPMSVVANLGYDEAILAVDPSGRPARSVRYYDDVRAVIKIDQGGDKPSLSPVRRLIVAQRGETGASQLYCPAEPLVREELDLIDVPGGSLVLDDVLPAEPVAMGQSWKLADDVLAALLCLDAVSWSDVQSVLSEVKDQVADVTAAGSLAGAVSGISTDIELKIKYRFDLRTKRITQFAMLVKEKRAVGHIGPGLDSVAKLIVRITPIAQSQNLSPAVISQVPRENPPELLALGYTPRGSQYRFQYDRRWYVTTDEARLTVLRMVDRGELVAQCNISALPDVKKPVPLAEFQKDIERTLDKNFGQFVSATQKVNEAGYAVFRVVVHGEVGGLPIEWIYYLIQDRQGHRVSLAFTLEQELLERFAAADVAMVSALQLTEPPAPTAAKPVQTK